MLGDLEDNDLMKVIIVLIISGGSPMCVSPLGGVRLTWNVAMLPTHKSGLVRFVCKDQDQD